MSNLRCIVYVSTAMAVMASAQLELLLLEAQRRNRDDGITGVLLYSDGNFMQYLEGLDDAVSLTYARIRRSRQHTGLIELLSEPIPERRFPDWQMGFARPTSSEFLAMSTAAWRRHDLSTLTDEPDSAGTLLLRGFWNRSKHPF